VNGVADLSNDQLLYKLCTDDGLSLDVCQLTADAAAGWLLGGPEFAVVVDGRRIDGRTDGLRTVAVRSRHQEDCSDLEVTLLHEATGLEIISRTTVYDGSAVLERRVDLRNASDLPRTVTRVDSFVFETADPVGRVMYYRSDWGAEFEPVCEPLGDALLVETRFGRSSKGMHPWLTLLREGGGLLMLLPVWSGNWALRCERDADTLRLSGGLHDAEFAKTLAAGETMEGVPVVAALGPGEDLHTLSVPLARVGRRHWYPANRLSRSLPVEWNPWWSYEDKTINEANFLDNAAAAARLGFEVCTLDAGWFGPPGAESDWYDYRGDWEAVNATRFPRGLRVLSDAVRGHGMAFGLWCEIEAAGSRSRLLASHPEYVASRDGESLGYVCFGNPDVQRWAYETLASLIEEHRCDWVKLDFNLEPYDGCNRSDHGHGAGEGLLAHYQGYYGVLDRIRARFPEVLLENCASGGLRIDLGMLRHAHMTFLSDPDWPEHSLQVFWGATTFLPSSVCLHWSYSDWLGEHPQQTFDPQDPGLSLRRFDYYTRIAMLHGFGVSQRLAELPDRLQERLAAHIQDYKDVVRRFIAEGDLYRLTGQPQRGGQGDRWAAFQYVLPEREELLLMAFRLPGAEPERTVSLYGLAPDCAYRLQWLGGGDAADGNLPEEVLSGEELLATGLTLRGLLEEESLLVRIVRLPGV